MDYTVWFVLKRLGIDPKAAIQTALRYTKSAAAANQQTAAGFQQPVSQLAPTPNAPSGQAGQPGQPSQEVPMTASPPNPFFQKLKEIIQKYRQKATAPTRTGQEATKQ